MSRTSRPVEAPLRRVRHAVRSSLPCTCGVLLGLILPIELRAYGAPRTDTEVLAHGAPAGAAQLTDARPISSGNTPPPAGLATPLKSSHGCLASGGGYLRAKIRGSLRLDVDFHNSELECDGGARPDGSGIRVSLAGPLRSDGRRLRLVFGIAGAHEGASGRNLPTNLTVIFEGEERIFATRGDDKCTVDNLRQDRVGALAGPSRSYRVVASGFCIAPLTGLNDGERLLITSFDFAGNVTFEDT